MMRKYSDAFDWAVLSVKLDAATAAIEAKRRLTQLHKEATWRLNEQEAQVLAQRFSQYSWRSYYGERRYGGETDNEYWERWNGELTSVHLGDLSRKSQLLP